jgi:hypothetical protein
MKDIEGPASAGGSRKIKTRRANSKRRVSGPIVTKAFRVEIEAVGTVTATKAIAIAASATD